MSSLAPKRRTRAGASRLLDKRKAGKKKTRTFGKVEIPQEAFIAALKTGE